MMLVAWIVHTALVTLASMAGFRRGSQLVTQSGVAPQAAETHRRKQRKVWWAMSFSRLLITLVLSLGFGFGGANFTNTWLTFSFRYGDPMMATSAGVVIAGQMALMFAVARAIAIGAFGQWSFRPLRA